MMSLKACLFDLDGVIVDTAKYHFIAWRHIARKLGFDFTEAQNERLKGVSRQRSLDILLEVGGLTLDAHEKLRLAEEKNTLYLEYVTKMTPEEILSGAAEFVLACRAAGYHTALATASRNANLILDLLKIAPLFDCVMDGNKVSRTKPDPEVFLNCARELGVAPSECAVFEDAQAGLDAAVAAGMLAIGIGDPAILRNAQLVVPGLVHLSIAQLRTASNNKNNAVIAP